VLERERRHKKFNYKNKRRVDAFIIIKDERNRKNGSS
jgi:hypothetical protein